MNNTEWKDLFAYTKNERRGILMLSLIIAVLIIYNVFGPFSTTEATDFSEFEASVTRYNAIIDSINKVKSAGKHNTYYKQRKIDVINLHYFDPNTITKDEWLELGIKDYQAKSILKYINKGGSFNVPKDLLKMYSLSKNECEILMPYVRIVHKKEAVLDKEYVIKKYVPKIYDFELNTVTFDSLLEISGIGPSTAKGIIKYREKLGGFYELEQLKEVYFIDSAKYISVNKSFHINTDSIKPTLDLNKGTYYTFKRHPYISKSMAYSIVEYRNMYGDYKSIDQIKNIAIINDSIYNRIYRYFAPIKL